MERIRQRRLYSLFRPAVLALALWFSSGTAQAQSRHEKPAKAPKIQQSAPATPEYDGVLVAFHPRASMQARAFSIQQQGLIYDTRVRSPHFALLRPGLAAQSAGKTMHTILEALRRDPAVRVAEPNYIVHATDFPNDPRFGELWGLHNTGQTGGRADADIDAPEAWGITTGSPTVTVAVIDSGVEYTHPDLAANIARDAQGRVIGYDYFNDDPDPTDDNGHGTHCAGTIGAVGNNRLGVIGVSRNVRIIPLKFLPATGSGPISGAIQCVDYATTHGAQIMSNSWGGGGYSQLLVEAIQRARQANILFIAAAGNDTNNNDQNPYYPASHNAECDNVITVASTDHNDALSTFSNYGAQSVDIAAPGSAILSTVPGGYGLKSGTSMATPHVSGVAALIKARFPGLGYREIKTRLLGSVDILPPLDGKVATKGRLNAHRALTTGDATAPARPGNLTATHRATTILQMQWTAPGDDDMTGTATRFEMRISNALITEANFANATPLTGVRQPAVAGTTQDQQIIGLKADTIYYVALRAIDDAGNTSSIAVCGPYWTLATPSLVTPLADNAEGAPKFAGPAPWAITAETAASPTRSYADSPGTLYADNRDDALTQTAQVALSGFNPELRVQVKTDLEKDFDFLYIEVSTDNGQTWSNSLLTLTGTAAWQEYRVSLAQYAGSSVRVRFRMVTDGSVEGEGVWLDDIRISGERLEPIAVVQRPTWRLVWQNTGTGDVSYWKLSDTTLAASGILARAVSADLHLAGAPDLNRDGKRDLLWHNTKTGDVSYWLMNDLTIKSQGVIYRGVPTDWRLAAVADLNEDGKADVLWQNRRSGDVTYWLMNGTAIASTGTLARAVPTVWQITAALNLDGDGSPDLLWRNTQNGDLSYWLLDGTKIGVTGTLARAVPLAWSLGAVADIDGDGDSDLVWQNTTTGDVSYWKMQDAHRADAGMIFRGVPKEWQLRTSF